MRHAAADSASTAAPPVAHRHAPTPTPPHADGTKCCKCQVCWREGGGEGRGGNTCRAQARCNGAHAVPATLPRCSTATPLCRATPAPSVPTPRPPAPTTTAPPPRSPRPPRLPPRRRSSRRPSFSASGGRWVWKVGGSRRRGALSLQRACEPAEGPCACTLLPRSCRRKPPPPRCWQVALGVFIFALIFGITAAMLCWDCCKCCKGHKKQARRGWWQGARQAPAVLRHRPRRLRAHQQRAAPPPPATRWLRRGQRPRRSWASARASGRACRAMPSASW